MSYNFSLGSINLIPSHINLKHLYMAPLCSNPSGFFLVGLEKAGSGSERVLHRPGVLRGRVTYVIRVINWIDHPRLCSCFWRQCCGTWRLYHSFCRLLRRLILNLGIQVFFG